MSSPARTLDFIRVYVPERRSLQTGFFSGPEKLQKMKSPCYKERDLADFSLKIAAAKALANGKHTVVEKLQEYIRVWLASKKHRSLKQLSEECGLNYGTVRNMADGKAVPNGETILRVLLVVADVGEVHAFVQDHLPHLTPYTKALTEFGGRIARPMAVTRRHCEILLELSFAPATPERLKTRFGPNAAITLEELNEAELVRWDGQRYQLSSDDLYFASQQFANELARLTLDNLNIDLKGNLILAQGSALSIEAARKVYRLMEATRNELLNIMRDPSNEGDEKVAITLAMTLF